MPPQPGRHFGERGSERAVHGALWRLPAPRSARRGRPPAMKSVFVTVGTTSFDDLIATACSPAALQVSPPCLTARCTACPSASTARLRAPTCPALPLPASACLTRHKERLSWGEDAFCGGEREEARSVLRGRVAVAPVPDLGTRNPPFHRPSAAGAAEPWLREAGDAGGAVRAGPGAARQPGRGRGSGSLPLQGVSGRGPAQGGPGHQPRR